MRYRFGLMIAALWWGSLTALGFVIVPMLFTHLPSPAVAGQVAAKLFGLPEEEIRRARVLKVASEPYLIIEKVKS